MFTRLAFNNELNHYVIQKKFLCLLLAIFSVSAICQENEATKFYQDAVKQSNLMKYRAADSLFTLSIDLEPHPDAYFNRAAIRSRLNNKKGRCEDLACAAAMDDAEALTFFCKECGKADTSYTKIETPRYWQAAYTVAYTSNLFEPTLIARHNTKKKLLGFGWNEIPQHINSDHKDSTNRVDQPAEFPGGKANMARFIQSNLSYPIEAREKGLTGKVYLRFTINSFGYIEDIKIVKGMEECNPCNYGASALIANMPRWTPAKINGKNVSVMMDLPIAYRIN